MDRERLTKIEQSDLSESRVNEDFVVWLKEKGWGWLLAILIGVTAFIAIQNFKVQRDTKEANAWAEYLNAELPETLSQVATDYADADYGAIPQLSYLRAGRLYLNTLQTNLPLGTPPVNPLVNPEATPPVKLTETERSEYLASALRYYQQAYDLTADNESQRILAIAAMNGIAAAHEAGGDLDQAAAAYEKVLTLSDGLYPTKHAQAQTRLDSLSDRMLVSTPVAQDVATEINSRNADERGKSRKVLPNATLNLSVFPPDEDEAPSSTLPG